MSMRKTAASTMGAGLLVAAATLGQGTVYAAPAEGVQYRAETTPSATTIVTDSGSMAVEDGVFKIEAKDGSTLAGTELSFRVDDFVFPIAAEIMDRTATLTPQLDIAKAKYQSVALPFENQAPWKTEYEREQAAWSRMTSVIGMGASIGTLVGGLGGAAVGCILGGIAGATVASTTTHATRPGQVAPEPEGVRRQWVRVIPRHESEPSNP
ncbi:hypothetical protein [Nocardia sp. NPDC050710]|uniref:hypothetical protein n=1 Tax=Nocardia sp. NPDC050710 TaxID=3157220 RepID=UPI0033DD86D9